MRLIELDSVDSTNAEARRMLANGEIDGPTCIVAGEQTAGRGTRGRFWLSPRDAGIYMTVVECFGDRPIAASPVPTFAVGVACAEALAVFDVDIRIKPVNDLVWRGGKLGGILTEAVVEGGCVKALVVGAGINVRRVPLVLEPEAMAPAFLEDAICLRSKFDLATVVRVLANRIGDWVGRATVGDAQRVVAEWERWRLPGSALPVIGGVVREFHGAAAQTRATRD